MSETVSEAAVEAGFKALHKTMDGACMYVEDDGSCDQGESCQCRREVRAILSAALPLIVAGERERTEMDDEQKVADAYQIVGSLADAFGVHDHPEVVRAMDWLAYGKTDDGSDILPWPREPLTAIRDDKGGE